MNTESKVPGVGAAPEEVVSEGRFNFGRFTQPIPRVNMLDAGPGMRGLRKFMLREWQAFQIQTPDHFFFSALYDTKKISLVQFIWYDIKANRKVKFERKVPSWKLQIPNTLFGSKALYHGGGCHIRVSHDIATNRLHLLAEIAANRDRPEIKVNCKAEHNTAQYQPSVVVLPLGKHAALYSHKCLMPVSGIIEVGDTIELDPSDSNLILDDHKGYYPYVTKYDWVTAMGFDAAGRRIGFNFTDNQVEDQQRYNENVLWLDGSLHELPPIRVERAQGSREQWRIRDASGQIDLTFDPVTHNDVDLNLLLMRSRYRGPYGWFNGTITIDAGETVNIDALFGAGEDFYLRG